MTIGYRAYRRRTQLFHGLIGLRTVIIPVIRARTAGMCALLLLGNVIQLRLVHIRICVVCRHPHQ